MTTNTNAASADLHRLGAKAFSEYLEDCDKHAIKRDIASAFTYAFEAGAALSTAAQPPADSALNTIAAMFHSAEEIEGPDGLAVMVDMALWNEALEAFDVVIGDEMEPSQQPKEADSLRARVAELEANLKRATSALQQSERVPLTDLQIDECLPLGVAGYSTLVGADEIRAFARAVEFAHGIGVKKGGSNG